MHCKTAQSHCSLQLDGRLSPEQAAQLELHLAGCEACRASRASMRAAWGSLDAALSPVAPEDWRTIAARLERPPSWLERLWLVQPGRFATAAALSVFLVAGVATGAWMSRGLRPSMPVEAVAMAEAFGDVAGAGWLASEGGLKP